MVIWHLVVKDVPEHQDLIVERLQLIVKRGVLALHLCQIDGFSHILRQLPIGCVLVRAVQVPGAALRRVTLV